MKNIYEDANSIVLIYAFNATGKTRLSVAYKELTKSENEGEHSGVYYNAFSEDLFVWDNDVENDNSNIRLEIKPSRLNEFHSLLQENDIQEKLELYNPSFGFEFNRSENPEEGIESVSFYNGNNQDPIKISRGEERIFVWCFFSALFEIEGGLREQDAHFFIDDPVSSLDEHNIYITANSIYELIEKGFEEERKIIITTHHIGLFSILYDRLKKGEKADRYKKNTDAKILSKKKNKLNLRSVRNEVFLFHLHLLQTLDQAIKSELYKYHFVLLRQLIENIASFLGSGRPTYCLEQIGIKDAKEAMVTINSVSHQNIYGLHSNRMSKNNEELFKEIFQKILDKYNFRI